MYPENQNGIGSSETADREPTIKPPLGLRPKYICFHDRQIEILEAIIRYMRANELIPIKWIEEYNDIVQLLKK